MSSLPSAGWFSESPDGGHACFRPGWALLFLVAGILGYNAGLPPYGIPIGLAMAALGWWITSSTQGARSAARQDEAAA